jgi:UDP-2,3-diacylglucosamine pyrophosphatase LpxH
MSEPYKIEFVWSGEALELSDLSQVRVDGKNLPAESAGGFVPNWWLQFEYGETQHAGQLSKSPVKVDAEHSLTVEDRQCVTLPAGRFLYMDVGRWLGGHQDFGIVAGNDAYLCEYTPGSAEVAAGCGSRSEKVEDELLRMPGVSPAPRHEKILDHFPGDANVVYLILPDMHLPEAPPLGPRPPYPPPPYDLDEYHHSTRNPAYAEWENQWGAKYREYEADFANNRDLIFHSRLSTPAMTEFLRKIQSLHMASQIILVQLGDMYELWADRKCYFVDISDEEYINAEAHRQLAVRIKGRPPDRGSPIRLPASRRHHGYGWTSSEDWNASVVGGWIAGTHILQWQLFQEFDACKKKLKDCRFLHGNHDSYLAVPAVVNSANQRLGELQAQEHASTVYGREKDLFFDGVFIEHGQRYDWPNRDGHEYGWDKTQSPIKYGEWMKNFDSTRRATFVTGAASWWAKSHRNFGLYVQGHTHTPDLKYVEVAHVRSDRTWIPVGKGGAIPVERKTPL